MGRKIFSSLVILLFLYIASPLFVPVALGAIFAVLFFPMLHYFENRRLSTRVSSLLITSSVTLLVLIPSVVLIFLGAKTGFEQLRSWRDSPMGTDGNFFENLVNTPFIQGIVRRIATWFPIEVQELSTAVGELTRGVALRMADILGEFLTRLPMMAMGLVIMVLSIYFLLVDGRKLVRFVRTNSFFDPRQTEHFIESFAGMCRSVLLASLVSGIAQSFVFSIAGASLGLTDIALIGFLVFIASFVPLIGSAPVTFGLGLYHLLVLGENTTGIILLVVAGVVTLMDNVIRPMVLKGASNLHPLLAFIAAFGGLHVMGFSGVFLGPILAGVFVVTMENLVKGPST